MPPAEESNSGFKHDNYNSRIYQFQYRASVNNVIRTSVLCMSECVYVCECLRVCVRVRVGIGHWGYYRDTEDAVRAFDEGGLDQ